MDHSLAMGRIQLGSMDPSLAIAVAKTQLLYIIIIISSLPNESKNAHCKPWGPWTPIVLHSLPNCGPNGPRIEMGV